MAPCNGDCSAFQAADGQWFKIDQAGYTNGQWASDKLIAGTSGFIMPSGSFIDFPPSQCRRQQMDLSYPRWDPLWSIRKSISSRVLPRSTEVTFLPCCRWFATRSLHFILSEHPSTIQAACMHSFQILAHVAATQKIFFVVRST